MGAGGAGVDVGSPTFCQTISGTIAGMIDQGMAVMKTTLES